MLAGVSQALQVAVEEGFISAAPGTVQDDPYGWMDREERAALRRSFEAAMMDEEAGRMVDIDTLKAELYAQLS